MTNKSGWRGSKEDGLSKRMITPPPPGFNCNPPTNKAVVITEQGLSSKRSASTAATLVLSLIQSIIPSQMESGMPNSGVATALISITALVYAASSVLMGHLVGDLDEILSDTEVRECKRIAYLSVAAGFLFLGMGVATLASYLTRVTGGLNLSVEIYDMPEAIALYTGSVLLLISVLFPTYATFYVSYKVYQGIPEVIKEADEDEATAEDTETNE